MFSEETSNNRFGLLNADYIGLLREKKPLVHCITNFVAMDITANALTAIGASPAMVHAEEEVEEFMGLADCLCINVGTLTSSWLSSMKLAINKANELNKPWVLDPVGAGATNFRTRAIHDLLALKPTLVRGNASEISALVDSSVKSRGVDSVLESQNAVEAGIKLAFRYDTIVVITGFSDYVTDGAKAFRVGSDRTRSQSTTKVSALGCSLSAVIAAFLACTNPASNSNKSDHVSAAVQALGCYQLASLYQEDKWAGPGQFRSSFLDALDDESCLCPSELAGLSYTKVYRQT